MSVSALKERYQKRVKGLSAKRVANYENQNIKRTRGIGMSSTAKITKNAMRNTFV